MLKRAVGFALALAVASTLAAGLCSADTITSMTAGTALGGASDADWWYGCSPTSAGMLMGYYDRNGYGGLLYDNLVPGGVAELSTYGNSNALLNGVIASPGHIHDFYSNAPAPGYPTAYMASGDDVSPTHTFDCLADFMGTSQDAYLNVNGATSWWNYTNGARLTDAALYALGPSYYNDSGLYGLKEYVEHAGYEGTGFNQYVDTASSTGNGFTWQDYKAEIDAGRPVLIDVYGDPGGHTMFAFGYEEIGNNRTIDLYDTWTEGLHTMLWGGSYGGMTLTSVTSFTLSGGVATPEPATCALALLSACMAAYVRRRRKSRGDRTAA